MDSAEKVTKFLRSKDHSSEEVIHLANQLLDDDLDLYLPNKGIFVFELICDRAGDNGKFFKNWKFDKRVWDLWIKCWNILGEKDNQSKMARGRLVRRVKIIEIIIAVLESEPSKDLIGSIFSFLYLVSNDSFVEVDESMSTKLICAYVSAIERHSPLDNWTIQIENSALYHTTLSTFKPTKKSCIKFACECAPVLLRYITLHPDSKECGSSLKRIIVRSLFTKTSSEYLIASIDSMLDTTKGSLQLDALKCFFELLIQNTNAKDIELPKAVIVSIREKSDFSDVVESLLLILAEYKRALPTSFVQDLYSKEKEKSTKDINWDFIKYLISLDVEFASNVAEEVFNLMSSDSSKNQDKFFQISETLLDSITKARELPLLLTDQWPKIIEKSELWKSDRFIELVADEIKNLSTSQINQIIENSIIHDHADILLCAIVRGLTSVTFSMQQKVKEPIISHFTTLGNSSHSWEIRYYLLSLYGEDIILQEFNFDQLFNDYVNSRFYLFAFLRYSELKRAAVPTKIQHQTLELVANDTQILKIFYERWLLMIDRSFSKKSIESFVELALKSDATQFTSLLNEDGSLFFELVSLSKALVKILSKMVNNDESIISTLKIIQIVPIQCFDKLSKRTLINSLMRKVVSSDKETNINSRLAISHLMILPSYTSSLELEFEMSLTVLKSSIQDAKPVSLALVQNIWSNHCNQMKIKESINYVEAALSCLDDFLSNYKPDGSLASEFEMAAIIFTSKTKILDTKYCTKISDLRSKFIINCIKVLNEHLKSKIKVDYENLNWILTVIYELIDEGQLRSDISKVSKNLGKYATSQNSKEFSELKINLFKLLTKTIDSSSLKSGTYVLSVFIALNLQNEIDLTPFLSDYLSNVSTHTEVLKSLCGYTLSSVGDFSKSESPILIQVLGCFINSLTKESMDTSINLFAAILSSVIENFDTLSDKSLLGLIHILKSSLNNKAWLFNQYCLESCITTLTIISNHISTNKINTSIAVDIYVGLTHTLSNILLVHRFRLSSRHHLIMISFNSLMEALTSKEHNSVLSISHRSAAAYSRVIGNLCEPMKAKIDESTNGLNSTSSLIKRSLRKHLPVLLLNYIYLSLKFNFHHEVNTELLDGIFKIYDVLSNQELELLNSALDAPGRAYFKTLYTSYKENGKWKDA